MPPTCGVVAVSAYRDYIAHASDMEVIRPLSNDERLAMWAARYYGGGWHRADKSAPAAHVSRNHDAAQQRARKQEYAR